MSADRGILSRAAWKRIRDAAVAVSIGHLPFAAPLEPRADFYYPWNPTAIYAAILDVVLVTCVAYLLIQVLRRARGRPARFGAGALLALMVLFGLETVRRRLTSFELGWLFHSALGLAGALMFAAAAAVGAWWLRRHRDIALRGAYALLFVLAPWAVFNVGRAVARLVDPPAPLVFPEIRATDRPSAAAGGAAAAARPRVVFVIFDMTDYRLAFEDRAPGFTLPVFDRLRATSTFATHAVSPQPNTVRSVPSLTTGRVVAESQPLGPGRLRMHFADSSTALWGGQPTLFSTAHARGANLALVGWYFSSCRIFVRELSRCWSTPYPLDPYDLSTFMLVYVRDAVHLSPPQSALDAQGNRYADMLAAQQRHMRVTLADDTHDLVFLHMAMPHGPFVWDRERVRWSTTHMFDPAHYVDNLALADTTLGLVLDMLETPGARPATLVITSDHSYGEASRVDGRSDQRVPFLVHFPGDRTGATYRRPVNTVVTSSLLLQLLDGTVHDGGGLRQFLDSAAARGPLPRPERTSSASSPPSSRAPGD